MSCSIGVFISFSFCASWTRNRLKHRLVKGLEQEIIAGHDHWVCFICYFFYCLVISALFMPRSLVIVRHDFPRREALTSTASVPALP